MSFWTIGQFLLGLVLLVGGAEALVRGAARLATAAGISPLVVGLTVVAFGTSSPELAVTVKSAFAGQPDIGLGNLVGSNICNVLLVLGVSAAILPLVVHAQLIRLDMWIMTGAAVLTLLLALDGRVGRVDGFVLTACGVTYTAWSVLLSRRENKQVAALYEREYAPPRKTPPMLWLVNGLWVAGGLALLVAGADQLVESAVTLARAFGLTELVIGLTVVAIGTSMPEVATSVVASIRGQRDIAVGNVVGSCVFNLLAVLGIGAAVAPEGIAVSPAALRFDLPVMVASSVLCLPVFYTGARIARSEGILLVGYFIAYTTYLVLDAIGSAALPAYRANLTWVVLPLTAVGLARSVVLAVVQRRRAPEWRA